MSNVNKVILIGSLGQDPELKHTPNGATVCNFSVATTERWNSETQGKQEKTEWHRIVIWGKQAENCAKYLTKGSKAYIEGKLQTRSWEDKEGKKRYTTEVSANTVQFLSSNRETNEALKSVNPSEAQVSSDTNFASDDIPF